MDEPLNTKERRLLEWVTRSGPLLESQVTASGMSAALDSLLLRGLVDMAAHPTVREHGVPAAAVVAKEGE